MDRILKPSASIKNAKGAMLVWINKETADTFVVALSKPINTVDNKWIDRYIRTYEYQIANGDKRIPEKLINDWKVHQFDFLCMTFPTNQRAFDYANQITEVLERYELNYNFKFKVPKINHNIA